MPKEKKKRKLSDSGSDSGDSSDDQKKPPRKNANVAKAQSKTYSDSNEPQWELSEDKIIKVREFKKKIYIDIRQYYKSANGDWLPTKKGISLTPELYQKFKKVMNEIDEEIAKY